MLDNDKDKIKNNVNKPKKTFSSILKNNSLIFKEKVYNLFYKDSSEKKFLFNNLNKKLKKTKDDFKKSQIKEEVHSDDNFQEKDPNYEEYNENEKFFKSSKKFSSNGLNSDLKDRSKFISKENFNNNYPNFYNGEKLDKNYPKPHDKPSSKISKISNMNLSDDYKFVVGVGTIVVIFIFLILSFYYFAVFQPSMEELESSRINKLNELYSLYSGPLAGHNNFNNIKSQIEYAGTAEEIKSINILDSATKEWRFYHKSQINQNKDIFGRILMKSNNNGSENNIGNISDNNILGDDEAISFVNSNDAKVLSKISFNEVDTIAVPLKLNRLQASCGLLEEGSVVNIYQIKSNNASVSSENTTNTHEVISGATILAILRSEDSGEIDSQLIDSNTIVSGNLSTIHKVEDMKSTNVENLLKSKIIIPLNKYNLITMNLDGYGTNLANYERKSNIGELETDYLILIEVPKENVEFLLNNMDSIVLTIPTKEAPSWMMDSLKKRFNY